MTAFSQAFSGFEVPSELEDALKDANIEQMEINRKTRVINMTLAFSYPFGPLKIETLRRELAKFYQLETVNIHVKMPQTDFGRAQVDEVLEWAKAVYPAVFGFLNKCAYELKDDMLMITVHNGGARVIEDSGCARAMEQKIREHFGRQIRLCVTGMEDPDEAFRRDHEEKLREKMKELLEEEVKIPAASAKKEKPKEKKPYIPVKNKPAPQTAPEDIILGKPFGDDLVKMKDIEVNAGRLAVQGEIFRMETREVKSGLMMVITADITDRTSSVRCKRVMDAEKAAELLKNLKQGMYVAVRGELETDRFEQDTVLRFTDIIKKKKPERHDTEKEKRVELHLHTQMSAMDGVTSVTDLVRQAAKWGHKAIAITDHGVAQAFPDAMHAGDETGIKIIYGTEGYYVNNLEDIEVVTGGIDQPIDEDFVCFDLETTGTRPSDDGITEIAASVVRDGYIIENFQTYVNPGRLIPQNITDLTGITNGMVADAPDEKTAVRSFLKFAAGRILVAHNANFDVSFVRNVCQRIGEKQEFTYIDTLEMSRILMPEQERHKLNNVAKALKLPKFNHHSGSDDARALALIFIKFIERMRREMGVERVSQINVVLSDRRRENTEKRLDAKGLPVYHIILLAKNEVGLKNLYKLISYGHLYYMNGRKQPLIPRNVLVNHREGLIIGSACEAGELFRAVAGGADWKSLCKTARFYDYLEIQPLGNNAFMLLDGSAGSEEDLQKYNKTIVKLGEDLGIPVAATGDVHFLEPDDEVYRRILMAGKGFDDADRQAPLYLRPTQDMLAEFAYLGEKKAREVVIETPNKIADLCEAIKPVPKGMFPPELPGSAEELDRMTRKRAAELYGDPLPEIVATTMERELRPIIKHGFDVMYMTAQKLIAKSNENGYMVGSRGSVGSSLVAHFLGITEVNALPPHYRCPKCRYSEFHRHEQWACGPDMPDKDCPVCGTKLHKDGFDIPFETFLGFDGDKAPDIDLNFSGEYQALAHKHTVELFGKENVFRAGTIGTVAEKTAFGYVKKYCEERGLVLPKAEEQRLALGCTGVKRTTGQHPGGMIVVPKHKEIFDFCAVQHPADDTETDTITTHVDYHSIDANLLKFDILGHSDPTMIKRLEELSGIKMEDIALNDPETLSLYSSIEALGLEEDEIMGDVGTTAVPEFGTKFVKQVLADTRPTTFDELVRVCGMTHGTDVWLNNAKEIISEGKATLKECICCRDDIMLYLIGMGVEPKLSFTIMEGVRKGKGLKPEWEEAMRAKDVPDWYITSCKAIQYMFPKAHAAAYVINGFRVAWYKMHKPLPFYCAFLSVRADALDADVMLGGVEVIKRKILELREKDKTTQVEDELQKNLEVCYEFCLRGFSFLPVDIYKSEAVNFVMEGDLQLRLPLTSIKGLGAGAAESIVAEAKKNPFLSIEEFEERCSKASKTVAEQLKIAGAFGSLPETSQATLF